MDFTLDPRLAADTHLLAQSELSLLLLLDDARYPWCILVPRRAGVSELHELSVADRHALSDESALLGEALVRVFQGHKLNVGALGNVVRQLHLHHVVRQPGDPAWPGPVWAHSPRVPRTAEQREKFAALLLGEKALQAHFNLDAAVAMRLRGGETLGP